MMIHKRMITKRHIQQPTHASKCVHNAPSVCTCMLTRDLVHNLHCSLGPCTYRHCLTLLSCNLLPHLVKSLIRSRKCSLRKHNTKQGKCILNTPYVKCRCMQRLLHSLSLIHACDFSIYRCKPWQRWCTSSNSSSSSIACNSNIFDFILAWLQRTKHTNILTSTGSRDAYI